MLLGSLALAGLFFLPACKSTGWEPTDPPCELDPSDPQAEPVETRCDGLDNDCDLHVDLLLAVDANRCQTGKQGACAAGYAACVNGARECLAPPPTAETLDGIDNDCNGAVDDVPASRSLRCRLLILLPDYLTGDSPEIPKLVAQAAESVGLPFDLVQDAAGWTQAFAQLQAYSLIVIPGYVMSSAFSAGQLEALGDFVEGGGVLIWQKLIGALGDEALMALAGVTAAAKTMEATEIKMGSAPATLYFDSTEERNITLVEDPSKTDEVYLYTLDPQAGAAGLGLALAGDRSLGTAMVRRSLGAGAVYTLGHGLLSIGYMRCYVNCFDPGTDLFAMLLKGALRESCAGHTVSKHTVPGLQSSLLTISHDVDAPDSHNEGKWGAPGAIQMAEAEHALGVKGTNFVTTDYVAAYYNPDMVKGICALGMCPEGPHSVQHLYMDKMPRGDCGVTMETYNVTSPTVCGEIVVSIELLGQVMPPGTEMITWRTPYLENPPDLYELLFAHGILFDSSMALGSVQQLPHLPGQLPPSAGLLSRPAHVRVSDQPGGRHRRPGGRWLRDPHRDPAGQPAPVHLHVEQRPAAQRGQRRLERAAGAPLIRSRGGLGEPADQDQGRGDHDQGGPGARSARGAHDSPGGVLARSGQRAPGRLLYRGPGLHGHAGGGADPRPAFLAGVWRSPGGFLVPRGRRGPATGRPRGLHQSVDAG